MKLYTPRKPDQSEQTLPLVNIVFLLLIFFMIAGKLTEPDAFEIALPESTSEASPERLPVTVSISADGRLAVQGEELELDDLQSYLKSQESADETLSVRLKADGTVDAQRVIEVMDRLRNAGIEKVWMLTTSGDGEA